jgi:hypothetical protein
MKPASQDQQPAGLERSVPAPAISTHGAMRHDKPGHLHVLLLLPTAATRLHLLLLHPTLLRALQDEDNDDSLDRPSIDTGGWDPGRQNGLHLLLLHPTLLRRDTTTTGHFLFLQEQIKDIIIMNISLPQINPRFNACSAG